MTSNHRQYWVQLLERLARPLLESLAEGRFWTEFPLAGYPDRGRDRFAGIESLSRLLAGIGPWLESEPSDPEEVILHREFLSLSHAALDQVTRPGGKGTGEWRAGVDAVVDAGFMSHAFLRAPKKLWSGLDPRLQANLQDCLRATKAHKPWFNNWLLFSAILETFLMETGETPDLMRLDFAIRQHEQWYAGDGFYKDGVSFHADYYNSFVIHPMLYDILKRVHIPLGAGDLLEHERQRFTRYAGILERQISPEGTFPPIGRSLAYRFGVFQALSQAVCEDLLPAALQPAQVRCALTRVMQRMAEAPGTFDGNGYLTIGFAGYQPAIGETYITPASCYLCATVLLPLGLPESHPFWSDPDAEWTSVRLWKGEDLACDKSIGN